jgi:restriction system protein
MTAYYRVHLGSGAAYAEECYEGGFIGVNFDIHQDLSGKFTEHFSESYIPVYLEAHPGKSKITAGMACSVIMKIGKVIQTGDIVLCPTANNTYQVGRVVGEYYYDDGILQHRRPVQWLDVTISRDDVSDALRRSMSVPSTVIEVNGYADEIESLLKLRPDPGDSTEFAMEKHLEDFLVQNWASTELGRDYDIYTDGQQYQTDTGPMDILAISKDKKTLLVVELKKGRASDQVVGQVQRYMGYVFSNLAEPHQTVRGVIIAFKDDLRIRQALKVSPNIDFYLYQISFKLVQV